MIQTIFIYFWKRWHICVDGKRVKKGVAYVDMSCASDRVLLECTECSKGIAYDR